MINTIVPQKTKTVFEFALAVHNNADNDTQSLIAAFSSFPSPEDWQQWLDGWTNCGYSLDSEPLLIRTV